MANALSEAGSYVFGEYDADHDVASMQTTEDGMRSSRQATPSTPVINERRYIALTRRRVSQGLTARWLDQLAALTPLPLSVGQGQRTHG